MPMLSLDYRIRNKREQADEIRVPANMIGALFDFMKAHSNIRYNIQFDKETTIEDQKIKDQLEFVRQFDYTICTGNILELRRLLEASYNAYFAYAATDWEMFDKLLQCGVSDVTIDGPLGFCENDIKDRVRFHEQHKPIYIRANPVVSLSALFLDKPADDGASSFFIRPEDSDKYGYISFFEFPCDTLEKEETLFNIYQRQYFDYNLSLLIEQLTYEAPNKMIPPNFAEGRLNCKQRCKQRLSSCHHCFQNLFTANQLQYNFERALEIKNGKVNEETVESE